jgi:hypothetical protein
MSEGAGAEDAVWRAIERRQHTSRLGNRLDGAVEIVGERTHGASEQQGVPVAVHGDLVACRHDLARERRPEPYLLTDEEEGCSRTAALELVEHSGGAVEMRAVVERQCDGIVATEPAVDAVGARDWLRDGGCGR